MWASSRQKTLALRQMRSLAPWPKTPLSQVVSPTSLTTSTTQRQLKSSSRTNPAVPSYLFDAELDDETLGRALSSPLFIQEREEKNQRTVDKLITLVKKVCCQLSPFSHTQVRGDPYTNFVRAKNENQVAKWRTKESGFSLKDKKSKFSLKSELRSISTNFKPILIGEVSKN